MSAPLIVGFGNPLLDISVSVAPSFLEKYKLNPNDAILAGPEHAAIYQEVLHAAETPATNIHSISKPDFVAGGSAQNTLRGVQYLLPAGSTAYVGCVGDDAEGKQLAAAAAADGLTTEYLVDKETPTGRCAVLVNGVNRSMVTDLLAANKYQLSHAQTPAVTKYINGAKVVYISGFFLTVSVDTMLYAAKLASEGGKTFALNLSAPFICQFFAEPLDKVLASTDLLFGNESEAEAYAGSHNWGKLSVREIAVKLAALPLTTPGRTRTVVITQGSQPTIIAKGDGSVKEYPVIPITADKIVDTNGAGDAFAAGFLSQLVLGKDVDTSVAAGNYLANVVIQRVGPTYPKEAHSFQG